MGKKLTVTYGALLQYARVLAKSEIQAPEDLVAFSLTLEGGGLFPEGISLEDAKQLFAHQDRVVPESVFAGNH